MKLQEMKEINKYYKKKKGEKHHILKGNSIYRKGIDGVGKNKQEREGETEGETERGKGNALRNEIY